MLAPFRTLRSWTILLLLTLMACGGETSPAQHFSTAKSVILEYSDSVKGLSSNPLKGLVSFSEDAWFYDSFGLPKSMEFFYIPLRDVMTSENSFDWTVLENRLSGIASRGNQAVFRFYLDYPHRETGIPQFLLNAGLTTYSYPTQGNVATLDRPDVSVVPNYKDPRLVEALLSFVRALGEKYDGDPRIGFIEAGLYGFWGEWHVFDIELNAEPSIWQMKQSDKDRLLNAYFVAFSNTKILARFPNSTENDTLRRAFGYHDDSFAYWTVGSPEYDYGYYFVNEMNDAGLVDHWQKKPIGGEIRPEISKTIWDAWPNIMNPIPNSRGLPFQSVGFEESVRATHASWMRHAYMFAKKTVNETVNGIIRPTIEPTTNEIANAEKGARLLGYTFHVPTVSYEPQGNGLRIQVDIENRGVAPFYYDWTIQLAFADAENRLLGVPVVTDWRLSQVMPGPAKRFSYAMGQVPPTARKLLLRVVNPLQNGHPLVFANHEQGRDLAPWLTLATE